MRAGRLLVALSLGLAGPALAQEAGQAERLTPVDAAPDIPAVVTRVYVCERSARVPVVYLNDSDPQRVVLMIEGRLVAMDHIRSADGAKYAEDGEGAAGYVWWTKGAGAMLDWIAEDGEAQALLSGCQEE
ncbi:MliC family protein [Thioclava atlantica]|uniref:C-type lysozyme inhibitor domain-containing protein n=1 Tax=Thioclava atlantica TaxID=1317124 RepID=A0A085U1V4_9RHOB|nr:MliC family protein [Thioclava atlantica]KFE36951.1 hypothetical protein DW2_02295 [Thioclava atlantica]